MQVNENGTIVLGLSEVVLLKGFVSPNATTRNGQPSKNAGKPYVAIKIDSRQAFALNPVQVEALERQGVRVVDTSNKPAGM